MLPRGVAANVIRAAEGGFVGGGDVVVLVDGGLGYKEHEFICMAKVAEAGGGAGAEMLLDAAEPGLGALPGVVWAVEEIRSVGAVAGGEEDVGGAGFCLEPAFGGEGVGGVVAVGDEAVGGVAGAGELGREWPGGGGGAEVVFERAVVAGAGAGDQRKAGGGLAGEAVACAADGVGTVEGGAGAVQDVDAGDGVERDGDIEIQIGRASCRERV